MGLCFWKKPKKYGTLENTGLFAEADPSSKLRFDTRRRVRVV